MCWIQSQDPKDTTDQGSQVILANGLLMAPMQRLLQLSVCRVAPACRCNLFDCYSHMSCMTEQGFKWCACSACPFTSRGEGLHAADNAGLSEINSVNHCLNGQNCGRLVGGACGCHRFPDLYHQIHLITIAQLVLDKMLCNMSSQCGVM